MKTKNSLLRATVLTGILTIAALPALAQNAQPTAPAANTAPSAAMPTDKAADKDKAMHKGDVAGKHEATSGKKDAHQQTAQTPAATKKLDEKTKADTDKKL